MKTILALLLVVAALAVNAKPVFLPLPGTPEGDAALATNPAPAVAPAVKTAPVITAVETPAPPMVPTPAPVASRPPAAPVAAPAVNPVVPAPAPAAPAAPVAAPAKVKPPEEMIGVSALRFQNAPLEQVLDFYAMMVNRTMLRPATLPAASITIKAQTELTKSEALQALDSVLGLNGIVMIPVGTKFIKVVPQTQAGMEAGVINTNDAEDLPDFGTYVTHVVQLRYTKPSELLTVLQPFAKVGPPLAIDSNGILIIRDYTENVKRMLELIAQIDVAVPAEFISEVIPIKYALASDIASALNSVGGGSSGAIGGGTGGGGGAGAGATGRSGFGGRSLTGGRNSTGGPQTVGGNNNNQYGANRMGGGATPVPAAGGAAAPTFQDRLRSIISKAASGAGGDFQLIGPNKIIPDERTNSLLVFASRQDMDMIKDIISKLDVVLAQVLIESIILDVTLADNFSFGVSAGQQPMSTPSVTGGGWMNGTSGINTGLGFLNNLIQTITTTSNSSGGFTTNITFSPNPNQAFPSSSADGLSYFGKIGPTWNVALSALAGKNNVKVLARPSIQTSQNAPASIFVGETRPYITGTYFDGYNSGSRSQYQQSQIGITLNVTPLINPDGLVVMDIQQQVQQVGGSVKIDGNDVPITQDQNASAKVAVRNGETIVMGGFIQNQKSEAKSGVPWLQDIPLLGALFRSTSTSGARRELLVMIRPTVLPTPGAAALETQVQRDRHPNLKQAEAEFNKEDARLLKRANKAAKGAPYTKPTSTYNKADDTTDAADDK